MYIFLFSPELVVYLYSTLCPKKTTAAVNVT